MTNRPTDKTILQQVRQLVMLMREEGLATVELRTEQIGLRLNFGRSPGAAHDGPQASALRSIVEVKAPASGVFLKRHPSGDSVFLAPGVEADRGSLLGLIQAGTVLLPVLAPETGVFAAYLVRDRTRVTVGTSLARLSQKRAGTMEE